MRILHISAHLGGGAGKAITGLINNIKDSKIIHEIIILEKLEKTKYLEDAKASNIKVHYLEEKDDFEIYLTEFDLIVVNWWNHPSVVKLLMNFPKIPVRIIIWSHVNGCSYPFIPFSFINATNKFLFTCYYSYDNKLWNKNDKYLIDKKTEVVFGFGNFNPKEILYKNNYKVDNNIRIGYVGTLNYSKLNKEFVKYCEKVIELIKNVEFILYGDIESDVMRDIKNSIYSNKFICKGYCTNIQEELLNLDIFGYPLNPNNYATTENSILEAMAVGLPIVTLNQNTEKYIIDNGDSGILAEDMEDYSAKLVLLCMDSKFREFLGKGARKKVIEKFNFEYNLEKYINICVSLLNEPKIQVSFNNLIGQNAIDYFLYFSGYYREIFQEILLTKDLKLFDKIPEIFLGNKKGSIIHFAEMFDTDEELNKLKILLDNYFIINNKHLKTHN